MQRVGSLLKPFATGMFMLFDREAFWGLGGFNERALFAEDYLLSKGVARTRFRIVRGQGADDESAVSEAGARAMVWMFFKTMLHSWDDEYFLRDQGYWEEAGGLELVSGWVRPSWREESFVDDDEEAFGAGEDGAVGGLDFGLVEELAGLRGLRWRLMRTSG